MQDRVANTLLILGAALIALGAGLVYLPAGLVTAGVMCFGGGLMLAIGNKR